ncbi:cysteine peptidase family C39 domain-containing protein [Alkalinema pantanalense CENA528]|uniref:cysteine peptidase family C39 domain-containing protein n=1 Tax=Alkalinema pantanalense TaxID=1620705 RepID=UPI003D6F39A9
MLWIVPATLALGAVFFYGGTRFGNVMLRRGATANDLLKGQEWQTWIIILIYGLLLFLAVNLPQMQFFPLDWRVVGMRITWLMIRVLLLGACGFAIAISWKTARIQLGAIVTVSLIGLISFTVVESYYLSPIHSELKNNLRPNQVFKQTSASSCAPSALATLLQRWGITQATESKVAQLAETSRMGTSNPQVIKAAQGFGLTGLELTDATWEQLWKINRPGILSVWLGSGWRRLPHAVALMAMGQDHVVVADPAQGKYYSWTQEELRSRWREEFVPIFRPNEVVLTQSQIDRYLKKLGFSPDAEGIRSFQRAVKIKATGLADPLTVLLLTGRFLNNEIPTLAIDQFERDTMQRMGCSADPSTCPW